MTSEDLPTFGRPITATAHEARPPARAAPAPALGQELGEPVEQVAGAAPVGGRDRDRLAEAEPVELGDRGSSAGPSTLFATTTTGRSARRRISATSASPWRRPARASSTIATASASAIASRAWPWTARESESSAARSTPPVSMSSNRTPVPLALERLAVAGDAGLLVDDRLAPADQPVDERRLADVGEADDGDPRQPRRAPCSAEPALARQLDDPGDHLVDGEPGGVDLDRVVGGPQRPVLALAVAARRARAGRRAPRLVLARLGGPPAGALGVARRRGRPSAASRG